MNRETHQEPSRICSPAKGSRWAFIDAFLSALETEVPPPTWVDDTAVHRYPPLKAALSSWGRLLEIREENANKWAEDLLLGAGVPPQALVEPRAPGVLKLIDVLRAGRSLAFYEAHISCPAPRKRKIAESRTLMIGLICAKFAQGSENANYIATADFLNDGMPACSGGGFDRNTVRREFGKFRAYVSKPNGYQLMRDAFFTLERILKIERKAWLDPRLRGLRGAELVAELARQHDLVEGFLRHLILPDVDTDLLRT